MSITAEKLSHVYMPDSPFKSVALSDVSFNIDDGEFIGLIGHTGSGKSTLIQHLNGLLKPSSGKVTIDGVDVSTAKGQALKDIRRNVGLVFQYPEHQLFEESIYLDVSFGPRNYGIPQSEIDERVSQALKLVGLDFEKYKDRSPFEISGGQRRRVAIAGVLAMNPKVLVLDEPTAGLDPKGKNEILAQISELHKNRKITIILVSHNMDDIARLADRIIVMDKGRVALTGTPAQIYAEHEKLESMGLGIPQITKIINMLREKGFEFPRDIYTVSAAKELILGQREERQVVSNKESSCRSDA
jgi:energy-coupling factor transport system ATP-binding protein